MLLVADLVTKRGDRVGDRKIKSISPMSADKIYSLITNGPRGLRPVSKVDDTLGLELPASVRLVKIEATPASDGAQAGALN
jgi:hypothetical protein